VGVGQTCLDLVVSDEPEVFLAIGPAIEQVSSLKGILFILTQEEVDGLLGVVLPPVFAVAGEVDQLVVDLLLQMRGRSKLRTLSRINGWLE
jgi:hypothetical protein